ncbi:aldehyde dehydrogenase family protein [Sinomonas sp. P47F7]|uniref:aldehyde dehydrogenase family protein n=1 Tax=Sinomonas sp. P47F7 TaxID=3410987 RepID=UPI003BF4AF03
MIPDQQARAAVAAARAEFEAGATRPLVWRRRQLLALRAMLRARRREFGAALAEDLGKSATDAWLHELGLVAGEVSHALAHLDEWTRPRPAEVPTALAPATAWTRPEPLGVVLVLGPWNYPLMLVLAPLVGALAAGNTVVVKPSELAPSTSAALARWVPEYLDGAVWVVEGGRETAEALLAERLDHVFFTGGESAAKAVAAAAARQLTPVTLELGGKSPAYVDATVRPAAAARRIAWGKFLNGGQTCVAPDYVLGPPAVLEALAPALQAAIAEQLGDGRGLRMVNSRHFDRVRGLLDGEDVISGGRTDRASLWIEPTLVRARADSPLMREEIFGPVLPLLAVDDEDAALAYVRSQPKPLALYVFSESPATRRRFELETSSGALAFGVPALHLGVPGLPFGGVGASGMGAYHGEDSFRTFSHVKAVLDKPLAPDTLAVIYPPHGRVKDAFARGLILPIVPRLPAVPAWVSAALRRRRHRGL